MNAVVHKPFTIAQLAQCLLEQVPHLQMIAPSLTLPQHQRVHARLRRAMRGREGSGPEPMQESAETATSSKLPEEAADVIDPDTFGQLQMLGAAKESGLLERLIGLYCEHAPQASDRLAQLAQSGEVEACGAQAHALKSMSLNIGAAEVARIAAALEQNARGKGVIPGPEDLQALRSAVERAMAALNRAIGRGEATPSSEAASGTPAPVTPRDGIEHDLSGAIERNELTLEYQPLVDRAGERVIGVEALVRWTQAGEDVPSWVFVPIAEQTGFIHELGEWVLQRACEDARAWPRLTVAVNVSPAQFRRSDLADRFEKILSASGIDPARVELEITETVLLDAGVNARAVIERLRRRGVSIALDDFGTGYSSLTFLRHLPIDKIKIDRSFVSNVDSAIEATIIHGVVSIARAMGLKVVAEGVETVAQQRFVAAAGVHAMQGYLFAHPMKGNDVAAFVAEFDSRARQHAVAGG
jgi:EAL domain-containing protein (putative c-di-GMP-specific phosphodiesterase class I)/HPt (histidine-containing phosphotransfer) domain-containing protein